jgi:hypothetical protein
VTAGLPVRFRQFVEESTARGGEAAEKLLAAVYFAVRFVVGERCRRVGS